MKSRNDFTMHVVQNGFKNQFDNYLKPTRISRVLKGWKCKNKTSNFSVVAIDFFGVRYK